MGPHTGLLQGGQEHSRKDGDDGDDHQKFDERETFFHFGTLLSVFSVVKYAFPWRADHSATGLVCLGGR